MTIWNNVWPANKAPIKEEIERMYKCAYYIDRNFLKPDDVVNLGLDVYKLKECGEVVMKKDLAKLRPHVAGIWERMSKAQRTMFLYSYFAQGVKYMLQILKDMEPLIGNTSPPAHNIISAMNTLHRNFPEELVEKINGGFGKEWA